MAGGRAVRVLVVDDKPGSIEDYRHTLGRISEDEDCLSLSDFSKDLFGYATSHNGLPPTDLVPVRGGKDALEVVRRSREEGRPFALAFVDPVVAPGSDGLEILENIRALDPGIFIVIVSADFSVNSAELSERVPPADRIFFISKPFYPIEIRQFTIALGARWSAERLESGSRRFSPAAGPTAGMAGAFDGLPAGIAVFDPLDRLLFANGRLKRLFPELAASFAPGTHYVDILRRFATTLLPEDAGVDKESWVSDRLAWHANSGGALEQELRGSRRILMVEERAKTGRTYCLSVELGAAKRRDASSMTALHLTRLA